MSLSRVYFARPVGAEGPVKIGFSVCPEGRLEALTAWSPFPLEIAATIEGDQRLEMAFHTKFAEDHSHREWFKPSPELSQTIEAVRAGTFDTSSLPEPRRLPAHRKPWTPARRLAASYCRRGWLAFTKNGFYTPSWWERELSRLREGQEIDRARVEGALADPPRYGKVIDAQWARESRAAFYARRGPAAAKREAA